MQAESFLQTLSLAAFGYILVSMAANKKEQQRNVRGVYPIKRGNGRKYMCVN